MMKILLIVLIIVMPFMNADQTAHSLLSQSKQQNEQKEPVKNSSVSYSEVAYHMAEGAVVTTVACLPTIICFSFCNLECSENYIYQLDTREKALLGLSAGFVGLPFPIQYALKLRDCGKTEHVKKRYDTQTGVVRLGPVSDQDILNARARLTGSLLAVLGIGVAVYRSLND